MKIALDAAKFTSEEANQLRKAMATFRSRGNIERAGGEDGRADGRARLRSGLRPALLRPDQGLRRIWLPRKPRGELRAPRLRVELAQVELSGGLRLRAAQLAADGLLCAGADRPRRARAWRRGARGRCELRAIGIARLEATARCASACARSTGCSARRRTGSSRSGPIGPSRSCAAAAACRCMRSSGSPPPMHSARWASTGARRCGIRARSSRRPTCRCSLMPKRATKAAKPSPRSSRRCRSPSMW